VEGKTCKEGKCVETGTDPVATCVADTDCKDGETCNNGACKKEGEVTKCSDSSSCSGGLCVDSACVAKGPAIYAAGFVERGKFVAAYATDGRFGRATEAWCRGERNEGFQKLTILKDPKDANIVMVDTSRCGTAAKYLRFHGDPWIKHYGEHYGTGLEEARLPDYDSSGQSTGKETTWVKFR